MGNGGAEKDVVRREEAFKLYCRTSNKSEVARILEVSSSVVFRWSREDRWDERREELRKKLQVFLDFKQELVGNTVLNALAADLGVLDALQQMTIEPLLRGEIRPKTWSDLLKTFAFVMNQKHKILGTIKDIKFPKGDAPPGVFTAPPILGNGDISKHLGSAVKPPSVEDSAEEPEEDEDTKVA